MRKKLLYQDDKILRNKESLIQHTDEYLLRFSEDLREKAFAN